MGWTDIKRRKVDILFSQYVRSKANWTCVYCRKVCKVGNQNIGRLDASHYFSRRIENTRFDVDNVNALCSKCHRDLGGHTKDENQIYDLWMKKKLGEEGYKNLKIRANVWKRRDDFLDELYVKQLLRELEN